MDINVKNTYDLFFHPFEEKGPTKKGFGRLAASVAIFIGTVGIYHLVVGSIQKWRITHPGEGERVGEVFQGVYGSQAASPAEAFFARHPQVIRPSMWKEWAKEAGVKLKTVTDEEAFRSLPDNFEAVLGAPCGIFGEENTVEATRMHAYIPPGLTAKDLGKILKGYRCFYTSISKVLKDQPTVGGWYEMTKGVIPGSRKQTYAKQEEMVQKLSKDDEYYEVPTTLETIALCLARFLNTQERLFALDAKVSDTSWTVCQEQAEGDQVMVGCFASDGLSVSCHEGSKPSENIGVAAMRKLS